MRYYFNDYKERGCLFYIIAVIIALALAFGGMCLEAWVFMLLLDAVVPIFYAAWVSLGFWKTFLLMLLLNMLGGMLFKSRNFKSNNN